MQAALTTTLLAQRGMLLCWVPVCLGIGIGGYFARATEPGTAQIGAGLVALLVLGGLARAASTAWRPVLVAVMLVVCGAGLATWRTAAVAAPALTFRYYGPIEGRLIAIDRSASDAVRLTLDRVVLARIAPDRTPARVRVSLSGDQPLARLTPGDTLIMTGHLTPPAGPAEPDGFDFQRHAWFLQIGAVGYTRTPVLRLATPDRLTPAVWVFATRMAISRAVQDAVAGEPGAFAAAIITGDRSGMGQGTLTDLRYANLAHLLAISGLHMGLLTGFVFAVVRSGLALWPALALRVPTKKIAALAALVVGAVYLVLSGGNVATERAFIMVAVMLVAVLLDRRALTLRSVAVAGIIVLVWQPEALTGPGFQMSFAATIALIAVFGALRRVDLHALPRWTRGALGVFVSSLVAGLATAPFAAAHFNMMSHYGLVANLASVPLMGVVVMPAAVLAACLAPVGLGWIGLGIMDLGLRWVLFVARIAADRPDAVSWISAPQPAVVPVLALAALWLILWRGRLRFAGLVGVVAAFGLWQQSTRPALLVADTGGLIGVMGAQGRALSSATGSGFVAGIWLENDGAPVAQDAAAARSGLVRSGRVTQASLGDWRIVQISGKTALAGVDGCAGADVMIVNQTVNQAGTRPRPCAVFDLIRLRDTGALALDLLSDGGLRITSAQAYAGNRPWNGRRGAPEPVVVLRP